MGPLKSTLVPIARTCPNGVSTSWNSPGDDFHLLRRICLNLRNRLKFSYFEGFLKFWEQEKVTWSQLGWVGRVGKNNDRVFRQKLTSSECWEGWNVVVMEKPLVKIS